MARYFMGDTRLEGLERMMMSSSRRPPAPLPPRQKGRQRKTAHSWPASPTVSKRKTGEGGV